MIFRKYLTHASLLMSLFFSAGCFESIQGFIWLGILTL